MRMVPVLVVGRDGNELEKKYGCIGMEIIGTHPFIVLSKEGERCIKNAEVFDKYSLFFHLLMNNLTEIEGSGVDGEGVGEEEDSGEPGFIASNLLIKSIKYPIFFINDEIGKKFRGTSTFLKIFDASRVGNLFDEHVYYTKDSFYVFGDENNGKIIFNTDIINQNEEVRRFYVSLKDFLETQGLLPYFDYATYIGQGAYAENNDEELEDEEHDDGEGEIFRWSPNVRGSIHGEIYDTAKQFIRGWYSGVTGDNITKCYEVDENGDILICGEDDGEGGGGMKQNTRWQIFTLHIK